MACRTRWIRARTNRESARPRAASGAGTHFNSIRLLANRVVRGFEGREEEGPADASAEPVIGTTALPGATLTLRCLSGFVPMPTTPGDLDEMALPAGLGVGLVAAPSPRRRSCAG